MRRGYLASLNFSLPSHPPPKRLMLFRVSPLPPVCAPPLLAGFNVSEPGAALVIGLCRVAAGVGPTGNNLRGSRAASNHCKLLFAKAELLSC